MMTVKYLINFKRSYETRHILKIGGKDDIVLTVHALISISSWHGSTGNCLRAVLIPFVLGRSKEVRPIGVICDIVEDLWICDVDLHRSAEFRSHRITLQA